MKQQIKQNKSDTLLGSLLKVGDSTSELIECMRDRKNISLFGVPTPSRWGIFSQLPCGVLIESDYVSARRAYEQLYGLIDVAFLVGRSDDVGFVQRSSSQADYERWECLSAICSGATHIVTYVSSAMQLYPQRESFEKSIARLEIGIEMSPPELASSLVSMGYRREDTISTSATFSVRGDIVDIMLASGKALRVYFDFDIIDKINMLDEELLSGGSIDSYVLPPVGESYYDESDISGIIEQLRTDSKKLGSDAYYRAQERIDGIESEMRAGKRNIPLIMPYSKVGTLSQFTRDYPVVIGDAKLVSDNALKELKLIEERIDGLIKLGEALPSSHNQTMPLPRAVDGATVLSFHTGLSQNRIARTDKIMEMSGELIPSFANDYASLEHYLEKKLVSDQVILACGKQSVAINMQQSLMAQFAHDIGEKQLIITDSYLKESFTLADSKQIIIGTYSLTHKSRETKKRGGEITPPPEVGDYVVHDKHGIGKVVNIDRLNLSSAYHDYVVVQYADDAKLYLPVENLERLAKFFYEGDPPKLSKMGGAQFARVKEKARESIKKMAIDLVRLYGERSQKKGYVYADEPAYMGEFISAFEHSDTPDQAISTQEGLNDLALGKVMDRLLCGDVGFGKTEVGMRIAYRVIAEGKQVALLCPTTLLAKQHYNTVRNRMKPFGVRVGMMSRLCSARLNTQTEMQVHTHELDIVVGTHKLLSKNLKFDDLGLLILDEEHRFGVAQKEKLKQLKLDVNVLSMSATPLPRTLHMSLSGFRDISMLTMPPKSRRAVETYVAEQSDGLIYDALLREKSRGGQSFIVFNRVSGIEQFALKVRNIMGAGYKVGIVHGQMASSDVSSQIEQFAKGEIDVIIATTIIENGIDLPNANTMVVVNSHMFGLSQMYQLRGRVGRGERQAYMYFTYPKSTVLSEVAVRRLDSIMQCKELGSGYLLAKRDLEIRGAGNILGAEQHGHMEQIGYDMYVKLLAEVMGELKGEVAEVNSEVQVHASFDAYIPREYIADDEWRVKQYGIISKLADIAELRVLRNQLIERYGKLPKEADNLLVVALTKNIARTLGACEVLLDRRRASVVFNKVVDIPSHFSQRAFEAGGAIEVKNKAHITFSSHKALFNFLVNYKTSA